jgi:hypothetical protein
VIVNQGTITGAIVDRRRRRLPVQRADGTWNATGTRTSATATTDLQRRLIDMDDAVIDLGGYVLGNASTTSARSARRLQLIYMGAGNPEPRSTTTA